MASTSIVATICAERLTKFLTRYSKAQMSNLRSNIPLESIKPNISVPTVQAPSADRKYSLWQSVENQFQLPLLEKPKSLKNINGLALGQQPKSKLVNASRMCLGGKEGRQSSNRELTSIEVLAQKKARAQALGKYASDLIRNRELSQTLQYSSAFTMCPNYF